MIKIFILMFWNGSRLYVYIKRRIYVDTRLHHMLDLKMNIPFFQHGLPGVVQNGSSKLAIRKPTKWGDKLEKKCYCIMQRACSGLLGWRRWWLFQKKSCCVVFLQLCGWTGSIAQRSPLTEHCEVALKLLNWSSIHHHLRSLDAPHMATSKDGSAGPSHLFSPTTGTEHYISLVKYWHIPHIHHHQSWQSCHTTES